MWRSSSVSVSSCDQMYMVHLPTPAMIKSWRTTMLSLPCLVATVHNASTLFSSLVAVYMSVDTRVGSIESTLDSNITPPKVIPWPITGRLMEVRETKDSCTVLTALPGSLTLHMNNESEPLYNWLQVTVTLSLGQVAFTLLVRLENPSVYKETVG